MRNEVLANCRLINVRSSLFANLMDLQNIITPIGVNLRLRIAFEF